MGFRRQLLAGYSAFVAISIATGALAVIALHLVGAGAARVAHRYTDQMLDLERVRFQAERVIGTARGYVITRGPDYLDRLRAATSELDACLRELDTTDLAPASADDLQVIHDDAHAYDDAARRVAEESPTKLDRSFERLLRPERVSLQERVDALAHRERSSFERALARSRDRAERAGLLVAIAGIAGLVISLLLALAVFGRLSRLYGQQRKAIDEARRSAASREEMLAIVSHDLRNPLSTVVAASDLLVMNLAGTSAARDAARHAATIQAAADRMSHLVDQILDTAKIDAGTLQLSLASCNVTRLLHAALDMFPSASAAGVLRCDVRSETLLIRADQERVMQVLSNLVGNALKFTPAPGAVEVRAFPVDDAVQFDVGDTGPGIPADQIGQVFDRYWQGSPGSSSRGVGLGLYICKKLVEAHGGRIWVDSRSGEGTCFHFTLPRATARQSTSG